jgi:hypothetical protein
MAVVSAIFFMVLYKTGKAAYLQFKEINSMLQY